MVTFAQARPGIFAGESGGDYNALYNYQNREGGRFAGTRLTDMSVGDVTQFTDPRGEYAQYVRGQVGRTATPVGAYQVVGTTLRDAVNALGIDPSTPFNQATQDRIGEWIFSTQGTGAWEGYRGPQAGGQGMEPQMMLPQGLLQQQPQTTDPFEGLSRNQRMMLGFSALRDAAASLEGRDTSFFNDQLGVFEGARERERLRVQGAMQNRAQAMIGLMPVYQEIQRLQSLNLPVPDYLTRIVQETLVPFGFGSPSGAPAMPAAPTGASVPAPAPAATTAPATTHETAPATTPTTPTSPAAGTPTAEAPTAEQPQTPAEARLSGIPTQREALIQQMRDRLGAGAATDDIEEQLRLLDAEEERLRERLATESAAAEAEAATTTQAAATAETLTLPEVDAAMSYLLAGMDESGNPVFNPMLVTPAGRWAAGVTQSVEYQDFVGAIETLGTGVLLDALENATVGALSEGERAALTAAQGALNPNNPAGTYRALRRIQQIAQESIARRNAAAGAAPQGGGTGELSWE